MRKIRLFDLLNYVDDELIEKALETDNAQKLEELKHLKKEKKYKMIFKKSLVFLSLILLFSPLLFFSNVSHKNFKKEPDEPVKNIPKEPIDREENLNFKSDIIEIESLSLLEDYLKLDLSKFDYKEIKAVYREKDKMMGAIDYVDDSSLKIFSKSENFEIKDTLISEKSIHGVSIKMYKSSDRKYAKWTIDDFTYIYYSFYKENIDNTLEKII